MFRVSESQITKMIQMSTSNIGDILNPTGHEDNMRADRMDNGAAENLENRNGAEVADNINQEEPAPIRNDAARSPGILYWNFMEAMLGQLVLGLQILFSI